MPEPDVAAATPPKRRRADATRNQQTLLAAAAAAFVESGVDAPVRDIAARAGVGMGTIYRHFPTRAELVVAVYRHQVEACAEAGSTLLAESPSPRIALDRWMELFVDFLVTKHGLAGALHSDAEGSDALHSYFVDRLVPVCDTLLAAATGNRPDRVSGYALMRGVGNLCIGAANDPRYDARLLVRLLVEGALSA
jgi:AcrR family transcriptional regulator